MSYVLAFLGFALLIVLHEGGHFVAAKAVGMRVERFSLFFGPMFIKRRIGETDYGVGVIPLGGYVKITGMSPHETFETPEIEARAYINQPPWKRIVVIAAGPAVNLLLAFVLAWVFFLGVGNHNVTNKSGQDVSTNQVAGIIAGSAAVGQLQVGDRVVSVDGVKGDADQVRDQIAKHTCAGDARVNGCKATTAATLVVRRHGALKTLHLRPRWSSADKEMLVGFAFAGKLAPNGVFYSAGHSATGLWNVTKATVTDIVEIFKPQDRKQLHSIVGAYKVTQEDIASGWTTGVEIIALISLSLGIINLFPFLPLDGGHIFWAVAEKIRGRRVPFVVIERASLIGIALIAILLFVGISNDISGLAGHGLGT
ncbi:MAG TPA: RIP metalloprotease [Solirubrobacteraceae bacterium]|jgi:regulator of sigma E protease|nr:RIP metalloprotease [Solirubrobacteraceae bacterium]